MSRTVSATLREQIQRAFSGDGLFALLTITHADLVATRRYVAHAEDVVSDGDTYEARSFGLVLPGDFEERVPEVTLVLDTVGETLPLELRDVVHPFPVVTLQLALISDPDTVEVTLTFDMRQWATNDTELRGDLTYEPFLDEPFPEGSFVPTDFPEMF